MDGIRPNRAHVIVVGNEKGGSGKSTAAMHLVVGLMRMGRRVSAIDFDISQGTLTRFWENRVASARQRAIDLPMPHILDAGSDGKTADHEAWLDDVIAGSESDVIVIDTPGSASDVGRMAHGFADTIVTPLNDSFVDFDVLARVNPQTMEIGQISHYASVVWDQKKRRAARDGGSIDWIVMRNRLSALDAISKRQLAGLLAELSKRIGFRVIPGFGERVIYRELFPKGLTIMDIREAGAGGGMTMSQIAARQEVRALINAVDGAAKVVSPLD